MEERGTLKVAYYKLNIDTRTTEMEVIEIADTLEEMQKLVGGYVEVYPMEFENNIILMYNKEGKFDSLHMSALVAADKRLSPEVICEDFFVCRASGEKIVSIEDDDMEYLKEHIIPIQYA